MSESTVLIVHRYAWWTYNMDIWAFKCLSTIVYEMLQIHVLVQCYNNNFVLISSTFDRSYTAHYQTKAHT